MAGQNIEEIVYFVFVINCDLSLAFGASNRMEFVFAERKVDRGGGGDSRWRSSEIRFLLVFPDFLLVVVFRIRQNLKYSQGDFSFDWRVLTEYVQVFNERVRNQR